MIHGVCVAARVGVTVGDALHALAAAASRIVIVNLLILTTSP
jgi:hypothetical protein